MKMSIPDPDDTPLTFGKYRGETPNEIAEKDGSYIVWLYDKINPKVCTKALALACEMDEREEDDRRYKGY